MKDPADDGTAAAGVVEGPEKLNKFCAPFCGLAGVDGGLGDRSGT